MATGTDPRISDILERLCTLQINDDTVNVTTKLLKVIPD